MSRVSPSTAALEALLVLCGLRSACLLEADAARDPLGVLAEAAKVLASLRKEQPAREDIVIVRLSSQVFIVCLAALKRRLAKLAANEFPFAICDTTSTSTSTATQSEGKARFKDRLAAICVALRAVVDRLESKDEAASDKAVRATSATLTDSGDTEWQHVSPSKKSKGKVETLPIPVAPVPEVKLDSKELPCCAVALTAALLDYPVAYWATDDASGSTIDTTALQGQELLVLSAVHNLRGEMKAESTTTVMTTVVTFSVPCRPAAGSFESNCSPFPEGAASDHTDAAITAAATDPLIRAFARRWMVEMRKEIEQVAASAAVLDIATPVPALTIGFSARTVTPDRVIV